MENLFIYDEQNECLHDCMNNKMNPHLMNFELLVII